MANVARDAHVVGCSAWRRRNWRLRAFWRHEQQAVRMAVAAATHHSYDRSCAHACTQTDLEHVTPAPVIECVAPAPAVSAVPSPVVEYIAPVPAVYAAPAPSVQSIAPPPVVYATQAPGVVSLAPAPVLSASPAPAGFFSPAPAVFRVGGLQGSVPGQSSPSRRGHDLPLPSGWRRAEDASGREYCWNVHTRQTRWTPSVTDDEDEDEEDEEDEVDEEVEDEDMDEIYAESRFPAGFLPMRMCRWFPSGNCRQVVAVHVRSQCERTAPPCS